MAQLLALSTRNEELRGVWRQSLLRSAVEWKRRNMIATLLKAGADVKGQHSGESALHAAARQGLTDLVVGLLEAGATVDVLNEYRKTP